MSYQFDLGALYQKAFGITMPKYELKDNEGMNPNAKGNPPMGKYGSSYYYNQDAIGRYYFMPVTLGDIALGYPIIRIQGRKNIVETQMTERKGSAIEIISQDNWKIYIRGFMFNHDRKYPEDDIDELKKLFERNESLELRSVLTDLFLVSDDRVVIADINFPEVKGIEHVKPYEINLISDSIFELEIQ